MDKRQTQIQKNNQQPQSGKIKKFRRTGNLFRMLVFFGILIALISITISSKTSGNISNNYSVLKEGEIDGSVKGTAYFIRKEITIPSTMNGNFIKSYVEGERVSSGSVIGYIVDENLESTLSEVKSIEGRIKSAQSKINESKSASSDTAKKLDEDIRQKTSQLALTSMDGKIPEYISLKKDIDLLLKQKSELVLGDTSNDSYIAGLQAERLTLQNKLKGSTEDLVASVAGVISYHIDGFENDFTNLDVSNISPKYLEGLKLDDKVQPSNHVVIDQKVIKIMDEIYYYVAVVIDGNTDTSIIKEGNMVSLLSEDRAFQTQADVVSIKSVDGKMLAVFKSTSSLASTISFRKLKIEVVCNNSLGLLVPIRSLFDQNDGWSVANLAIIRSNYIQFKRVKILTRNKEYAIIDNIDFFDIKDYNSENLIQVNDLFIVDPSKVYEGQVIDK